jgi:hypothetical protein
MLKIELRPPIRRQADRAWLVKVALAMLLIMGLLKATNLSAQEPATVLEFLEVELWPDFDQPAVLVLLSGGLPDDVPLPATITLPLPEEATINAVARVDPLGNLLNMEYDDSVPGQLTLNASDPGFRIEYYVPYKSDGDLREFSFRWLADMDVNQLITTFQQPSSATDVILSPVAFRSQNGQYNMLYHEIQGQVVPAGVPYTFEASYRMIRPELSAEVIDLQQPPVSAPSVAPPGQDSSDGSDINWPIVLAAAAAVLAFAAVAWLIYSGQKRKRRVIKPRPAARTQRRRSAAPAPKAATGGSRSKFCSECGQPLDPADKFCRNCGTGVKGN